MLMLCYKTTQRLCWYSWLFECYGHVADGEWSEIGDGDCIGFFEFGIRANQAKRGFDLDRLI